MTTDAAWGPRITAAQHTPFASSLQWAASETKGAAEIQCGRRTPRVER
jgi:hypothetical protein